MRAHDVGLAAYARDEILVGLQHEVHLGALSEAQHAVLSGLIPIGEAPTEELIHVAVLVGEVPQSDWLLRDAAADCCAAGDSARSAWWPAVGAAALQADRRHRHRRRNRHTIAAGEIATLVFRTLVFPSAVAARHHEDCVLLSCEFLDGEAQAGAIRTEVGPSALVPNALGGRRCADVRHVAVRAAARHCAGGHGPRGDVNLVKECEVFPSGGASRWDDVGANLLSSCLKLSGSKGFVNFRSARNA
jgi:hypothetical protein